MVESRIEERLKSRVEKKCVGAVCLKFVSPGCSGVPDRLILLPGGKAIFVELKQKGKKERKRQTYLQERIRGLEFEVFSSVDSDEKIERVVERCLEVMKGG